MHIVLVTTEFVSDGTYGGGLANYTYRIAKSLLSLGHGVTVVYLQYVKCGIFEFYDGIPIFYAKPLQPLNSKLVYVFRKIISLVNRINSFNAAEVERFLHFLSTSYGVRKAIAQISHYHQLDIIHYTHLWGIGAFHDSRLPSVVRLSSYRDLWLPYGFPFSSPAERFFEDLSIKRASAIIAPSTFVGDYVENRFRRSVSVLASPYVPNEQDLATTSDDIANNGSCPYGLYFGSICSWKGIVPLIAALKIFFRKNFDYHFVFIGRSLGAIDGKDPKEFIKTELAEHISRYVILESMRHEHLYPFIQRSTFVCFPTLADNFPNVVLESMAHKKLIISTSGRGVDEQIQHHDTGILVPPGDHEALARAMCDVAAMLPEEIAAYGERAYQSLARFTPERCASILVAEYEKTIASHREKRS